MSPQPKTSAQNHICNHNHLWDCFPHRIGGKNGANLNGHEKQIVRDHIRYKIIDKNLFLRVFAKTVV